MLVLQGTAHQIVALADEAENSLNNIDAVGHIGDADFEKIVL